MSGTTTTTAGDQKRPKSDASVAWRSAGAWGLALAVFYAVFVRFYQGAGGRIGLPGDIDDGPGFQMASYQAGVLILVGGAACIVLTHAGARRWPRWLPRRGGAPVARSVTTWLAAAPCAVGGVFATVHGIGGIVTNAFELFGWIHIDRSLVVDPTPEITRAGDLWGLLLYEPWFLAMGLALLGCVWHYALVTGHRERSVRRLFAGLAIAVVVMSLFAIITVSMGIIVSTD